MKLLFLDIDGVTNNRKSLIAGMKGNHHPLNTARQTMDRDCVARLRTVVEKLDLKIVVSSTWRRDMPKVIRTLEWCGWKDPPVIGATTTDYAERGQQIADALKGFAELGLTVEAYVILDDDVQDIWPRERHVKTEFEAGLTDEDCAKIEALFTEKP